MTYKYRKNELVKLPDGTKGKILVPYRSRWSRDNLYLVETPPGSERVQLFNEQELKDDK